jgi:hypothetical protein
MVNAGSGWVITCILKADTFADKVKEPEAELHSFVQISQENLAQLDQWITRLHAMSSPVIGIIPFDGNQCDRLGFAIEFTDEYGNRARTTTPFLSYLLRVRPPPAHPSPIDLDERLWWALASDVRVPDILSDGPSLTAHSENAAIEHWTQVELCALHALWNIYLAAPCEALHDRIIQAGTWVMNELQPDNAINRPWGISVFVYLSISLNSEIDRSTASMYAQTLAHNCSISLGKPDTLSACILHDAARSLEQLSPNYAG